MTELRTALADLSLAHVSTLIERREVSSLDLTNAALDRIGQVDGELNAFITVLAEEARRQAAEADREIAAGNRRGPLHGIPVSAKDLLQTAGVRTTAGSVVLREWVPDENAHVVDRLNDAGAVLLGKVNMLEFAYGSVHPAVGAALNPWDRTRSASGSSSGSAVAVAAGMGYGSIGSDTGGSIRLPAAFCGIVGLKPTYGRVSRRGAIALSWSCDHVGPMTRTVADNAILLGAIAGHDPRDPTSATLPVPDYAARLDADFGALRIGITDDYLRSFVDPEVLALVEGAIDAFAGLGAEIVEVKLPPPSEGVPALIAILTPEATESLLQLLRERPEDFSQPVRERLELGLITSALSYVHAQRIRRRFTERMLTGMADVDLLLMPTSPVPATPLDDDLTTSGEADPALLAAMINYTGPFDLTGFPALSLTCGLAASGLPVGLQLVAKPFEEAKLFAAAHRYEQLDDFPKRLPPQIFSA